MYFFYRAITAVAMLFLAPYYAFRGWRRRQPGALMERLGRPAHEIVVRANADCGAIWIHAVSVGEVLAAKPLVDHLKQRFLRRAIVVSTTTETGQRLARERIDSADGVFYFPLDWSVSVRRALRAIRPALVIVMETEIWPNFLREARNQGVPVVFANARISERSLARYKRWKFLVGPFFERVLPDAELFLAQTPEDSKRLAEMGAPKDRVEVTGNLKYDSDQPAMSRFGVWLEGEIQRQERWPVIVAGSVVAEEEEAVLAAYDIVQRRWRRALLILAPRQPDRFEAAAGIASGSGWNVARRSHIDFNAALDESADLLVLDSIGELASLYSLADAVFVGGSLVLGGGHNILEPAWFAKPPVFGPSMENFRNMAEQFLQARAAVQVTSGQQLGKVWVQLIEDNGLRERMGQAAFELSERNRGATGRSIELIATVLASREQNA
jgi:3-deoxy-D-manno-octulosonic-acid transferase